MLDSVKRIKLTLKNGVVALPSNSISSFQIVLSKTMGFAQVPDLYLFPYYDLDSAQNQQDYWYRRLTEGNNTGSLKDRLLFNHIVNWNPSEREMYDFNVGDISFGEHYSSFLPVYQDFLDTVIARQDFPAFSEYTYKSWSWRRANPQGPLLSLGKQGANHSETQQAHI